MGPGSRARDLLRMTHRRASLSRAVGRDAVRCGPQAAAADDEERCPDRRRPGSPTGPWAPTSLTRLEKAKRRPNGRRSGAVSPADRRPRKGDAAHFQSLFGFSMLLKMRYVPLSAPSLTPFPSPAPGKSSPKMGKSRPERTSPPGRSSFRSGRQGGFPSWPQRSHSSSARRQGGGACPPSDRRQSGEAGDGAGQEPRLRIGS
jgi:hypothetical protein